MADENQREVVVEIERDGGTRRAVGQRLLFGPVNLEIPGATEGSEAERYREQVGAFLADEGWDANGWAVASVRVRPWLSVRSERGDTDGDR